MRTSLEVQAARCIGDGLFGPGNYDLVKRAGYVSAYGLANGKPLLVLVRTSGDYTMPGALNEFHKIYQFIGQDTRIVLVRTDNVRAVMFLDALARGGYRVSSIIISEGEFRALVDCEANTLNNLVTRINSVLGSES